MQKPLLLLVGAFIVSIGAIYFIYNMTAKPADTPISREPGVLPTMRPIEKPGNPGIPEEPPISPAQPTVSDNCAIGGCSGQLCVDASSGDVASTCEYRAEYACYQTATCERQTDGKCGWTMSTELRQCLTNARSSVDIILPQ